MSSQRQGRRRKSKTHHHRHRHSRHQRSRSHASQSHNEASNLQSSLDNEGEVITDGEFDRREFDEEDEHSVIDHHEEHPIRVNIGVASEAPFSYPIISIVTILIMTIFTSIFSLSETYFPIIPPYLIIGGFIICLIAWSTFSIGSHKFVSNKKLTRGKITVENINHTYRKQWTLKMRSTPDSPGTGNLVGFLDTLKYAWDKDNAIVAWASDLLPAVIIMMVWLVYSLLFIIQLRNDDTRHNMIPEQDNDIIIVENGELPQDYDWGIFDIENGFVDAVHYVVIVLISILSWHGVLKSTPMRRLLFLFCYVALLFTPREDIMAIGNTLVLSTIPRLYAFIFVYLLVDIDMKDAAKHVATNIELKSLKIGNFFYVSSERRVLLSSWILWNSSPFIGLFFVSLFPMYRLITRTRSDSKKDDDVSKHSRRSKRRTRKHKRSTQSDIETGVELSDVYQDEMEEIHSLSNKEDENTILIQECAAGVGEEAEKEDEYQKKSEKDEPLPYFSINWNHLKKMDI